MKKRLDLFLFEEGYFQSREMAKAAVMEGLVSIDGDARCKPGTQVTGSELIEVRTPGHAFVSRGGIKLEHALDFFDIDVGGTDVLDVGSSTGGFTDCLLQRGAARVIALDVGRGQLHSRLRNDPRVTVLEGRNARYLTKEDLPFEPRLAVADVSFISLRKVVPNILGVLGPGGELVALFKPQFEAGRKLVGKGGVVRDPSVHERLLEEIAGWLEEQGIALKGITASPVRGPKGNLEFFIRICGAGKGIGDAEIVDEVTRAHEAVK